MQRSVFWCYNPNSNGATGFDTDNSGSLEAAEVLAIGTELGWAPRATANALKTADTTGDGIVEVTEFAQSVEDSLPNDTAAFATVCEQLVAAADLLHSEAQRNPTSGACIPSTQHISSCLL